MPAPEARLTANAELQDATDLDESCNLDATLQRQACVGSNPGLTATETLLLVAPASDCQVAAVHAEAAPIHSVFKTNDMRFIASSSLAEYPLPTAAAAAPSAQSTSFDDLGTEAPVLPVNETEDLYALLPSGTEPPPPPPPLSREVAHPCLVGDGGNSRQTTAGAAGVASPNEVSWCQSRTDTDNAAAVTTGQGALVAKQLENHDCSQRPSGSPVSNSTEERIEICASRSPDANDRRFIDSSLLACCTLLTEAAAAPPAQSTSVDDLGTGAPILQVAVAEDSFPPLPSGLKPLPPPLSREVQHPCLVGEGGNYSQTTAGAGGAESPNEIALVRQKRKNTVNAAAVTTGQDALVAKQLENHDGSSRPSGSSEDAAVGGIQVV